MKRQLYYITAISALVLLGYPGTVLGADQKFALVTHPQTNGKTISRSEVKSILLGRKKKWDDGQRTRLVMVTDKETFEAFSKNYLNKTMAQYLMYWKRMVLTGKGAMPKRFTTIEQAVAYVKETPGAIAVIPKTDKLTGVKLLSLRE